LTILVWQWVLITCNPGVINDLPDLPDFRKPRDKTTISTKHPSYSFSSEEVFPTTTPSAPSFSSFQPIQLTQEDVVTGAGSAYGSQSQFTNGGIIFAISQGQNQGSSSGPLMSAGELMKINL
jgi:hypothetical protein